MLSCNLKVRNFEYLYVGIMVIYMSRMVPETNRMMAGFGFDFSFLLPIFLTLVLLCRNRISLPSKKFCVLFIILLFWTLLNIIYFKDFFSSNYSQLSYYFFLFYSIIIAYIQVEVYGKNLFFIFEDIVTKLSLISIILWGIGMLFPFIASSFYSLFPDTGRGFNILYIFHWDLFSLEHSQGRNSGTSWEPGYFATIITLALCINFLRYNKVNFRNNKNFLILLTALVTTFSTTGFMIFLFLFIYFLFSFKYKKEFLYLFFIIPLCLFILDQDFMQAKLLSQLDVNSSNESFFESTYYADQTRGEGEYVGSLGRFQTIYFQFINISKSPIIGYGLCLQNSYFYNHISSHYALPGGLLQVFGNFGIPLGLLLYWVLLRSSVRISKLFNSNKRYAIFLTILLASISYNYFTVPIVTAIWLYSFIKPNNEIDNNKYVSIQR